MARRRPVRLRRHRREAQIELSAAELAELDDAIAEAEGSDSVPSEVVLAELDRVARTAK